MAKGVKKIKMFRDGKWLVGSRAVLKADNPVKFDVQAWLEGTTAEEKEQDIYWLWQNTDRSEILKVLKRDELTVKFTKKLSGPYTYYLEGSLSGRRDFKNPAGIYLNGTAPPRIVKSEWRKTPDGKDTRKEPIAYGDIIYLWLDTEGLHGSLVDIEIYNNRSKPFSDTLVSKEINLEVVNGEVLYSIGNTSTWMGKVHNIASVEEFFIIVKNKRGQDIIDHNSDNFHARFLRIKNELVSNQIKPSENITASKIGDSEKNVERFEPCKFEEIIITAPTRKDGKMETKPKTVFKNGSNLLKGGKGNAIEYSIVIPSTDQYITIDAVGLEVKEKDCYQDKDKHKEEIVVIGPDKKEEKADGDSLRFPVKSTLSTLNPAPIQYIWPKYNATKLASSAAIYNIDVHSCRYHSNKKETTLKIHAYPDIKWTLEFKWNHKASFVYSAGNKLHPYDIKTGVTKMVISEMDRTTSEEFGEMAQSFEMSLEAKWNKDKQKAEVGKEWGEKIAKTLKIFNKMKAATDAIAKSPVNGGKISFEIKAPVIAVSAEWELEPVDGKSEIGTKITFGIESKPLVEAEGKINLWKIFREYGPNAICPGAGTIVNFVLEHLEGNIGITFLVKFNGSINVKGKISGNTLIPKDTKGEIEIIGKIQVTLEFKAWAKGDIGMAGFEGYLKADVNTSVSGGIKGEISREGLCGYPVLEFGGIIAKYVAVGTVKFGIFKRTFTKEGRYVIVEPNKADFDKRYIVGPYKH